LQGLVPEVRRELERGAMLLRAERDRPTLVGPRRLEEQKRVNGE
jgi:hypothetical protein